jgi:hypothetical protein
MTITETITLGLKLKNKHPELNDWKVTLNNRVRSFGLCSYSKKEIQMSKSIIPYMSDESIKNTLIHEIAHALTKGHSHDWVWSQKCIELGGDGKRVGGDNKYENGKDGRNECLSKLSKYTLTCPCCGETHYKNRLPKRKSSCGNHNDRFFNPKHELVITTNY